VSVVVLQEAVAGKLGAALKMQKVTTSMAQVSNMDHMRKLVCIHG
jgi:hypothetical protein